MKYPLMNEAGEFDGDGGGSGDEWDAQPQGEEQQVQPYLRDLTEDDVYDRLTRVTQYPDQLRALESRLFGSMGPISEKLQRLEKSVGTQVGFDPSKLEKVLQEYDPILAEKLVPALKEALRVNPLDEATLSPYLNPVQENMQGWMGEQIVLASYDPEEIGEMIPDVVDGRWNPTTQRHKDFIDWFAVQGLHTQQALQKFGAGYVRALKRFEKYF